MWKVGEGELEEEKEGVQKEHERDLCVCVRVIPHVVLTSAAVCALKLCTVKSCIGIVCLVNCGSPENVTLALA